MNQVITQEKQTKKFRLLFIYILSNKGGSRSTMLVLALVSSFASLPRGVPPSKEVFYIPRDGMFTCIDGMGTYPFSSVNDDFCDCADGSDEPGTSACPSSVFWCGNKGHRQMLLPSYVSCSFFTCTYALAAMMLAKIRATLQLQPPRHRWLIPLTSSTPTQYYFAKGRK